MNKKGYTWVEILIAVFIIAVLAMSIAFVLGFWRDQANDSQKVSDIRKIREALELYFEKHAEYPATLFDLVEEGFLTTVPVPPHHKVWKEYIYVPLGENVFCTNYHIGIGMKGTGAKYLEGDKDAYKSVLCRKSTRPDFDGTALNCDSKGEPKGKKADPCYDLQAF